VIIKSKRVHLVLPQSGGFACLWGFGPAVGAGLPQSGNFAFLRGLGPRRVLAFAKKFLFVLAGS
jgi:hypothetical protein